MAIGQNILTYNGMPYIELVDGSGKVQANSQGTKAQRSLKCAWADRVKMALSLRGFLVSKSGIILYTLPAIHPAANGLYVTDANWSPMGKPLGEDTWEYARLDLQYGALTPSSDQGVELQDESVDLSGEFVDLGKDGWSFGDTYDDGNVKVDRPISKLVPMLVYTITQYHIQTLPLNAMRSLLGCINSSPFKGADPNFVMYTGGKASRKTVAQYGMTIVQDWTVDHKFLVGNRDLLKEWKPTGTGAGTFQRVVSTNGTFKFDTGDFSTLGVNVS